ncbi:UNVERIFIED_CONTAM: hypothetical protein FKN15_039982 [Acipenser sinensis]
MPTTDLFSMQTGIDILKENNVKLCIANGTFFFSKNCRRIYSALLVPHRQAVLHVLPSLAGFRVC